MTPEQTLRQWLEFPGISTIETRPTLEIRQAGLSVLAQLAEARAEVSRLTRRLEDELHAHAQDQQALGTLRAEVERLRDERDIDRAATNWIASALRAVAQEKEQAEVNLEELRQSHLRIEEANRTLKDKLDAVVEAASEVLAYHEERLRNNPYDEFKPRRVEVMGKLRTALAAAKDASQEPKLKYKSEREAYAAAKEKKQHGC